MTLKIWKKIDKIGVGHEQFPLTSAYLVHGSLRAGFS